MAKDVPYVSFNNGIKCPIIGLGTWKSEENEVEEAVKDAIDAGYRHFDCAFIYENEKAVGRGLNAKIQEGAVKREDLFVVSKLWNTFRGPRLVQEGIELTLSNLNLNYLDLYLIHWPIGFQVGGSLFPMDEANKVLPCDISNTDTWKEMEKLVERGLVKSIGISNFNSKQVDEILSVAKIKPVVNQVECHPYLNQKKLKSFCESKGILITAYSPLGGRDIPYANPNNPILIEDAKVAEIANKHKKTAAQILLRYQVQQGNIVIPKSVTKSRIYSNIDIFDFKLSDEEVCELDSLDRGLRYCSIEAAAHHKQYPFNIEY